MFVIVPASGHLLTEVEFSFGSEVVGVLVKHHKLGKVCNVQGVVVIAGVKEVLQAGFDEVIWVDVGEDVLDGFVVEEFVCVDE